MKLKTRHVEGHFPESRVERPTGRSCDAPIAPHPRQLRLPPKKHMKTPRVSARRKPRESHGLLESSVKRCRLLARPRYLFRQEPIFSPSRCQRNERNADNVARPREAPGLCKSRPQRHRATQPSANHAAQYGSYHSDHTNVVIHIICVPLILITWFGMVRTLLVPVPSTICPHSA
jgi:hypothetical protein